MVDLVYSPQWFYGKDIIIDVFSIVTLFLVSFFSFRYYLLTRNKKNLILTSSFFLMGVSFLAKIITNFTLYYDFEVKRRIGDLILTYHVAKGTDLLFNLGFLSFRLLTLFGLYLLYLMLQKKVYKREVLLVSFFIIITTYFSSLKYFVFYLSALLFLWLIAYQYHEKYRKNKLKNTKLLVMSFSVLAVSQALFILIPIDKMFYVIAEIVQLAGYLLLLVTFISVLKHGKKTKPPRHHK